MRLLTLALIFTFTACVDGNRAEWVPDATSGDADAVDPIENGSADWQEYCLDDEDCYGYVYADERLGQQICVPLVLIRDKSVCLYRDQDYDGDGLNNVDERFYGTDPYARDTDFNGYPDPR